MKQQIEARLKNDLSLYRTLGGMLPDQIGVSLDGDQVLDYLEKLEKEFEKMQLELINSHKIRTTFAADIERQHCLHQEEIDRFIKMVNQLQTENRNLSLKNQEYSNRLLSLTKQVQDLQTTLQNQRKEYENQIDALRKQQVEDKKEMNILKKQQIDDKKMVVTLSEKVQKFEQSHIEAKTLCEFSEWIYTLRELIVDEISINYNITYLGWKSFAEAEAKETRTYKKLVKIQLDKTPERPLNDALVLTYKAWGFTDEEWLQLRNFKSIRDNNSHSKQTPYKVAERMLTNLSPSLMSYSSVLAKVMKVVNDRNC